MNLYRCDIWKDRTGRTGLQRGPNGHNVADAAININVIVDAAALQGDRKGGRCHHRAEQVHPAVARARREGKVHVRTGFDARTALAHTHTRHIHFAFSSDARFIATVGKRLYQEQQAAAVEHRLFVAQWQNVALQR